MTNATTGAFSDCYRTMDLALRHSGLRVEFPTDKKAVVFRHRCYKGRALLFRLSERSVPVGVAPHTPYDDIVIRLEHEARPDGKANVLLFELRSSQQMPVMTDLAGKPLAEEIAPAPIPLKLDGVILDD